MIINDPTICLHLAKIFESACCCSECQYDCKQIICLLKKLARRLSGRAASLQACVKRARHTPLTGPVCEGTYWYTQCVYVSVMTAKMPKTNQTRFFLLRLCADRSSSKPTAQMKKCKSFQLFAGHQEEDNLNLMWGKPSQHRECNLSVFVGTCVRDVMLL